MSEPTQRHIVVVDTETSGLDAGQHSCVEIAWWDLNTGERDAFIPRHDVGMVRATGDDEALRIGRYDERIAHRVAEQDHYGLAMTRLANVLNGHTLAGSNPTFDASFLKPTFRAYAASGHCVVPEWHHRLWDLAAYTAGVLGLDHLPGLAEVRELLGIAPVPDHTAEGDVTVTGLCFLELFCRTGVDLGGVT